MRPGGGRQGDLVEGAHGEFPPRRGALLVAVEAHSRPRRQACSPLSRGDLHQASPCSLRAFPFCSSMRTRVLQVSFSAAITEGGVRCVPSIRPYWPLSFPTSPSAMPC